MQESKSMTLSSAADMWVGVYRNSKHSAKTKQLPFYSRLSQRAERQWSLDTEIRGRGITL